MPYGLTYLGLSTYLPISQVAMWKFLIGYPNNCNYNHKFVEHKQYLYNFVKGVLYLLTTNFINFLLMSSLTSCWLQLICVCDLFRWLICENGCKTLLVTKKKTLTLIINFDFCSKGWCIIHWFLLKCYVEITTCNCE